MAIPYNRQKLLRDWMDFDGSLVEFAKKKSIHPQTIHRYSSQDHWVSLKRDYVETRVDGTDLDEMCKRSLRILSGWLDAADPLLQQFAIKTVNELRFKRQAACGVSAVSADDNPDIRSLIGDLQTASGAGSGSGSGSEEEPGAAEVSE